MTFDWQMPRDPFADDPNDPASLFDDDDPMPPLTQEERIQIERDLILNSRLPYNHVALTEFSSTARIVTNNIFMIGTS